MKAKKGGQGQSKVLPNRFAKAELSGAGRAPVDRRSFENNYAKPKAYKGGGRDPLSMFGFL